MTKLTVRELMQLKNEVGAVIKALTTPHGYGIRPAGIEYGVKTVGGRQVTQQGENPAFPAFALRLGSLLDASAEIHTALARANEEHGITAAVRRRENERLMLSVFTTALQHAKPYSTIETVNVAGGGVERVQVDYQPHTTASAIKEQIKSIKRAIRELQAHVDAMNSMVIEVPFDVQDVTALLD